MMNNITCILVDDEANARENLRLLLGEFCPEVNILAEASNVDDAVNLIEKHSPKLVFLDIEMPKKNGFHLLDSFNEITFEIIFVTAYDHYAVKAFEVTALDYLLKPLEVKRLQDAVQKVDQTSNFEHKIEQFNALKANRKDIKKIAIPYKNNYAIYGIDAILCFQAERMYTKIYTTDNKEHLIAKKMSFYENLLLDDHNFIRVHRSWIINTSHLEFYSKKEKELQLTGGFKVPLSKTYKEVFEQIII